MTNEQVIVGFLVKGVPLEKQQWNWCRIELIPLVYNGSEDIIISNTEEIIGLLPILGGGNR